MCRIKEFTYIPIVDPTPIHAEVAIVEVVVDQDITMEDLDTTMEVQGITMETQGITLEVHPTTTLAEEATVEEIVVTVLAVQVMDISKSQAICIDLFSTSFLSKVMREN